MNNSLLALVVGLAAGICGALVPGMLRGEPDTRGEAGHDTTADLRVVLERLDRIEEHLAASRPMLRGSAGGAGEATTTLPKLAAGDEAVLDAILARYDERMRRVVGETVAEKLGAITTVSDISEVVSLPQKKKVTLAEFAQELELSSYQEDELRRLHEQTMEKMIALLATEEDGGVETVRRDLDEAKGDPTKATALMGKYIGRLIGNIGGFIMLDQEHDKNVKELLGEDKAARLENDFQLSDVDPYDLETVITMGFGE